MTRLVVDLDELARSVQRMQLFAQQLTGAHDAVQGRMRELHVAWTGEAASAHAAAQQHWDAAADEVHDALAVLASIVGTAHANYTAAAAANRRMWSG